MSGSSSNCEILQNEVSQPRGQQKVEEDAQKQQANENKAEKSPNDEDN